MGPSQDVEQSPELHLCLKGLMLLAMRLPQFLQAAIVYTYDSFCLHDLACFRRHQEMKVGFTNVPGGADCLQLGSGSAGMNRPFAQANR
jgi:hypothetical protein